MRDAEFCYKVLLNRKPNALSTHFIINWDGTIIQGMDPMYVAFHAGGSNSFSIGIDLNNEMPNLLKRDNSPDLKGYADKYAEHGDEFRRFESRIMKINGTKKKSYGYTDVQYQALIELLKVLDFQFLELQRLIIHQRIT